MSEKVILKQANDLIVAQLQDRNTVFIPCIGQLAPVFQAEYILVVDGERKLMPPTVTISYMPSEYLLRPQHYTTLDFTAPQAYFEKAFIGNLADLHDLDERAVVAALMEHCKGLLDGLFRGRRVSLLELGDLFVTEEVEGVLILNFVLHPELTKAVNFVFSAYKPTVLKQGVVLENTEVRYSELEQKPSQHIISQAPRSIEEPESEAELVLTEAEEEVKQEEAQGHTVQDKEVIGESSRSLTEEKYEYKYTRKSGKPKLTWLYLLLGLALVGGAVYFITRSKNSVEPAEVIPEVVATTDNILLQQPEPAVALPLDTVAIERGGSLAKLAKEYYNNNYYWVYIYMANKDSIPNPNNLSPGQTIVIPPLEWYDLKSDPEEALHEAQEWSNLILAKQYTSFEEQRDSLKPFEKGRQGVL